MTDSRLRLLEAIQDVQARFIEDGPRTAVFATMLQHVVELSDSEFGFVGECEHDQAGGGVLRVVGLLGAEWGEAERAEHAAELAEERTISTSEPLCAEVQERGAPVIRNDGIEFRRLPGAPEIRSLLALPLRHENELVGMIVVLNREGGYAAELADALAPFVTACARVLVASNTAEERRHSAELLRESESRFRQLAEHLHEVFWLTDIESGNVIYVSPAYEAIWGRAAAEIYEDPNNWVDGIHPDDRAQVHDAFVRVAEMGGFDEEYRVVRPDGTIRWVHDRGFPFHAEAGRLLRVAGIVEDITNRKRMEESLRRSEQRLRHSQRVEALGRVAGGVAHDFNNLLTAINGNANSLLSRTKGPAERQLLQQIAQAGNRAAGLTKRLLAFSRKQVLELRVIDLHDLFADLRDLLPPILGGTIEMDLVTTPEPLFVRADMHQLVQVVVNLAVNARDAMPAGGRLMIACKLGPAASNNVELHVADSGSGIDKEILPLIFDPFFTTKSEGEGSGLGLAMVYGIVTQLGGTVEVDTGGTGSTFRIQLPVAAESQSDAVPAVPVLQLPQRPLSILLVDDEPLVRSFASVTLQDYGHTVLEAGGGDEAVNLVRGKEGSLDLLITDVVMPGAGGRVVADKLCAANPELKVLYISGYTAAYTSEFGDIDARYFLQKPFLEEDLIRKIQELLSGDAG